MAETTITLQARGPARSDCARIKHLPFTIEHIFTPEGTGCEFEWDGASSYLALHDVMLADGRMLGDDVAPITMLDMRRRMTFLPRGVRVSGWCEPARLGNSFTVLYFDQDWLLDELEVAPKNRQLHPKIYFQHKSLQQTMEKLGRLARAASAPKIMADSLAIMAGHDLMCSLATMAPRSAGLTSAQLGAVRDFIHAHLAEDISLSELAAVVGLSAFHFSRQFKRAIGVTPYRHVLEVRTEHAKHLMRDTALPLSEVAQMSGFSSGSQFSKSFADIVGVSPRDFRRAHR
jgi:AraC family transcriptional regulator